MCKEKTQLFEANSAEGIKKQFGKKTTSVRLSSLGVGDVFKLGKMKFCVSCKFIQEIVVTPFGLEGVKTFWFPSGIMVKIILSKQGI